MNWSRIGKIALLLLHVALGIYLVTCLVDRRRTAEARIDARRAQAEREHRRTQSIETQVRELGAIKQGLLDDDPYAVELMARTRFGYAGEGEISPPPRPVETEGPTECILAPPGP